jgi:hypothetical protein
MTLNKLNKFVNEIYKLTPLSDELLLKICTGEIVLLKKIAKQKKINTKSLFENVKGHFSRAQFYRYIAKLKKSGFITVKNAEITINN